MRLVSAGWDDVPMSASERGGTIDAAVARWGLEVRRRRLRAGLTQTEVAHTAGVSQSIVSRMELGRGGAIPARAWISVTRTVGESMEPSTHASAGSGLVTVVTLARAGGWAVTPVRRPVIRDATVWQTLSRPPRPMSIGGRNVLLRGETAAVLFVDVVAAVDRIVEDLRTALDDAGVVSPPGWATGGLVVVQRSMANRRRLSEGRAMVDVAFPDSGSVWIGATRSPTVSMPWRPGLVWLDERSTRLIPTGLRLRRA
jgi:Helix-turn-helix domain